MASGALGWRGKRATSASKSACACSSRSLFQASFARSKIAVPPTDGASDSAAIA